MNWTSFSSFSCCESPHVLTSKPRGGGVPDHRASPRSSDIICEATRIRFSCEFLPLHEPRRELVVGNASMSLRFVTCEKGGEDRLNEWGIAAHHCRGPKVTGSVRANVTAKGDDDDPAPRCEASYVVTGKARRRERVVGQQQPRQAEDEGLV
jgi:hypothetical protein